MSNILITGGTGFIGRELLNEIAKKDPFLEKIYILTRSPNKLSKIFSGFSDKVVGFSDFDEMDKNIELDLVVNLAGEPIAKKNWNEKQKEKIRNSRVGTTKNLVKFIGNLKKKPPVMISASAIGYYGSQGDEVLDEDSKPKKEFTHNLCKSWESEARKVEKYGTRLCITRIGLVLGKEGGALKRMLPAFRFGMGGKIASGKQVMSWVHLRDVVRGMLFLINKEDLSGVFNLCAPNAVTNEKFAKTLGKSLSRPTLFDMPLSLVKLIFGEMGEVLLASGQNVYPQNLIDAGFNFKYKRIDSALRNVVK